MSSQLTRLSVQWEGFKLGMVPIDRQGKELLCLIRAGATWFESVRLDNGWGVEDTETMSLFHETYHLLTITILISMSGPVFREVKNGFEFCDTVCKTHCILKCQP